MQEVYAAENPAGNNSDIDHLYKHDCAPVYSAMTVMIDRLVVGDN